MTSQEGDSGAGQGSDEAVDAAAALRARTSDAEDAAARLRARRAARSVPAEPAPGPEPATVIPPAEPFIDIDSGALASTDDGAGPPPEPLATLPPTPAAEADAHNDNPDNDKTMPGGFSHELTGGRSSEPETEDQGQESDSTEWHPETPGLTEEELMAIPEYAGLRSDVERALVRRNYSEQMKTAVLSASEEGLGKAVGETAQTGARLLSRVLGKTIGTAVASSKVMSIAWGINHMVRGTKKKAGQGARKEWTAGGPDEKRQREGLIAELARGLELSDRRVELDKDSGDFSIKYVKASTYEGADEVEKANLTLLDTAYKEHTSLACHELSGRARDEQGISRTGLYGFGGDSSKCKDAQASLEAAYAKISPELKAKDPSLRMESIYGQSRMDSFLAAHPEATEFAESLDDDLLKGAKRVLGNILSFGTKAKGSGKLDAGIALGAGWLTKAATISALASAGITSGLALAGVGVGVGAGVAVVGGVRAAGRASKTLAKAERMAQRGEVSAENRNVLDATDLSSQLSRLRLRLSTGKVVDEHGNFKLNSKGEEVKVDEVTAYQQLLMSVRLVEGKLSGVVDGKYDQSLVNFDTMQWEGGLDNLGEISEEEAPPSGDVKGARQSRLGRNRARRKVAKHKNDPAQRSLDMAHNHYELLHALTEARVALSEFRLSVVPDDLHKLDNRTIFRYTRKVREVVDDRDNRHTEYEEREINLRPVEEVVAAILKGSKKKDKRGKYSGKERLSKEKRKSIIAAGVKGMLLAPTAFFLGWQIKDAVGFTDWLDDLRGVNTGDGGAVAERSGDSFARPTEAPTPRPEVEEVVGSSAQVTELIESGIVKVTTTESGGLIYTFPEGYDINVIPLDAEVIKGGSMNINEVEVPPGAALKSIDCGVVKSHGLDGLEKVANLIERGIGICK